LLGVWTFSTFIIVGHGFPRPYLALAIGGAALVTLRHRQNIGRLLRGEEKRT
jgi:glycerol-3-phosphate acyltransferase PlsY